MMGRRENGVTVDILGGFSVKELEIEPTGMCGNLATASHLSISSTLHLLLQ